MFPREARTSKRTNIKEQREQNLVKPQDYISLAVVPPKSITLSTHNSKGENEN